MPKGDGEEEGRRINTDSSASIYVTASVEYQCRVIAQNRKMKEEENIKNTKVNALKRATRTNHHVKSFTKLVANLPNDMMASEDSSTPPPPPSPPLPSQPTSSRTPIHILAERWVSCLIRRNGRWRSCGSGVKESG